MDRFFFAKNPRSGICITVSKKKKKKTDTSTWTSIFFAGKTNAGKVGSQISWKVLKLVKVIITRVVVAWPTSTTFLKAPWTHKGLARITCALPTWPKGISSYSWSVSHWLIELSRRCETRTLKTTRQEQSQTLFSILLIDFFI